MNRITLYELESPEIKIYMGLYFNDKNELVFEGYDVGKRVLAITGDSDYEYHFTVAAEEVEKMAKLFELNVSDKSNFLKAIHQRFKGNEAYSRLILFMKENEITFSSFIY